jgi:hypothetical protein
VLFELSDDEYEKVHALPVADPGMSNFHDEIDDDLEDALRAGMTGRHNAWNFNGLVWFGERDGHGMFCEVVHVSWQRCDAFAAPSLRELMTEVNNEYGWD